MRHNVSVLLLLCVGISLTIDHIGAQEVKVAPWQDLLIHDCNHGLHILPSSELSTSFDGSMFNTVLNHVLSEVKKRAKCNEKIDATRKNILCTYMPSVEMFMQNFVHEYKMDTADETTYNKAPWRNFFTKQNPIFRAFGHRETRQLSGLFDSQTWITLKNVWPHGSCDVKDFLSGKPCNAQLDLEDLLGVKIGLTVQKCSDETQYAPYFGKFYYVINSLRQYVQ
jgi:hypothetical protein